MAAQYTNMVMSMAVHTMAEKIGTIQYCRPNMMIVSETFLHADAQGWSRKGGLRLRQDTTRYLIGTQTLRVRQMLTRS